MADYRGWLNTLADCPDCNAAQLKNYGAKWRCPNCAYYRAML